MMTVQQHHVLNYIFCSLNHVYCLLHVLSETDVCINTVMWLLRLLGTQTQQTMQNENH